MATVYERKYIRLGVKTCTTNKEVDPSVLGMPRIFKSSDRLLVVREANVSDLNDMRKEIPNLWNI